MSMISEQVKNIREVVKSHRPYVPSVITEALTEAADTIEALSEKLAAAIPKSKSPLGYEEHEDYDEGICPICGNPVCDVYNYCPECGQHIKWRGGVYKEVDAMAGMNYTEKILTIAMKGITKEMFDMDNYVGLTASELQGMVDSIRLVTARTDRHQEIK